MLGDEERFKAAAGGFREYGIPFWLAVTQLEHAESQAASSRADEAARLVEEAREIFTRLGATPWLERADALGAASPPAAAPV